MSGRKNNDIDIDLGLAVLSAIRKPGQIFGRDTIAAACNCSKVNIDYIEKAALKKLMARLWRDPEMRELYEQITGRTLNLNKPQP